MVVALGGQTPLKLANRLPAGLIAAPAGCPSTEPRTASAGTMSAAGSASPNPPAWRPRSRRRWPSPIGSAIPSSSAPSYVLGGRAMQICYDAGHLKDARPGCSTGLFGFGELGRGWAVGRRPVPVDRFLEDVEVDVDAVRDATGEVLIGGVMEHVEAGVHSGDSACAILRPRSSRGWSTSSRPTPAPSEALDVRGLLNVQYACAAGSLRHRGQPRASRTVPFVAKATGVPLAKVASHARSHAGRTARRGLLLPPRRTVTSP